ncbi:MAG: hypothetical protein AAGF47_09455 [Planctomycetota bacterium]
MATRTDARSFASLLTTAALVAALSPCAALAQPGVDDIQAAFELGESSIDFAQSIAGLVTVRDGVDLGIIGYDVDDENNTDILLLELQAGRVFDMFGAGAPGLLVEGAATYARASGELDDLFFGLAPGFESEVDFEFRTLTGQIGAGPVFEAGEGITLTPMVNLSASYIVSDADYGGPGALIAETVADGVAFNWEAGALAIGVAARAEYVTMIDEDVEFRLLGRYDGRFIETIAEDDPAQEFSGSLQFFTIRAGFAGPTETELFGGTLGWRGSLGYTVFAEGDIFGSDDYLQLTLGADLIGGTGLGTRLTANVTAILGEDLDGIGGSLELGF